MDKFSKQEGSKIAELIEKGREQGFLTYDDVNDHLPDDISDPDQVEEIIGMINDLGLQVHEKAPDLDTLMLRESENTDDIALEQAAEALAAVENETGRTTDPVRMYMREMGTVDLLTREGEIEIAKRIEEGMRDLLLASAQYPRTVEYVLSYFQLVKDEEKKLNDLLTGFLEEMEEVPSAGPGSEKAKQLADKKDDDENDGELDFKEVQRRMTSLKRQYNKTMKVLDKNGRSHKKTQEEFEKLGNIFKFLKFSPRMFEEICIIARHDLETIRSHERIIQTLCVKSARVPRKDFLEAFKDNFTKMTIMPSFIKNKKYKKDLLEKVKQDVMISQKEIKALEEKVGLSSKEVKDNWEKIKSLEKNNTQDAERFFEDVPLSLPALTHATKVQKKASQLNFDWTNSAEVLSKINEEVKELWHACETNNKICIEEEFGDVLFTIVNLGRKLDVDPEKSLGVSIKKFKKRVSESIKLIKAEKVSDKHLTDKKLHEIWEHAKDLLKKNDI